MFFVPASLDPLLELPYDRLEDEYPEYPISQPHKRENELDGWHAFSISKDVSMTPVEIDKRNTFFE